MSGSCSLAHVKAIAIQNHIAGLKQDHCRLDLSSRIAVERGSPRFGELVRKPTRSRHSRLHSRLVDQHLLSTAKAAPAYKEKRAAARLRLLSLQARHPQRRALEPAAQRSAKCRSPGLCRVICRLLSWAWVPSTAAQLAACRSCTSSQSSSLGPSPRRCSATDSHPVADRSKTPSRLDS